MLVPTLVTRPLVKKGFSWSEGVHQEGAKVPEGAKVLEGSKVLEVSKVLEGAKVPEGAHPAGGHPEGAQDPSVSLPLFTIRSIRCGLIGSAGLAPGGSISLTICKMMSWSSMNLGFGTHNSGDAPTVMGRR